MRGEGLGCEIEGLSKSPLQSMTDCEDVLAKVLHAICGFVCACACMYVCIDTKVHVIVYRSTLQSMTDCEDVLAKG
jgi:hypothetical protein